jgi:signal transduction histidine kinase
MSAALGGPATPPRTPGGPHAPALTDDGPGIAPDRLAHVFEPFFTTKARGTGLGLAIARKVVQAHGGRIDIASRPGAGTTVRLALPLEPGAGGGSS